jgi:hypothetical protein
MIMRKNLLSALVASAFALGAGGAQAALTFDLNGAAGGGVISVQSFDWAPTSFLALGGNTAIANYNAGARDATTEFDVLTHAKLSAYIDGAGATKSLPAGLGEITLVGRFTEKVVGFSVPLAGSPQANFVTTGAGWVQMYYSNTAGAGNSVNLTGANFNDGRLIMTADGVSLALGTFQVDGTKGIVPLDGAGANDYPGQLTVQGAGSQGNIQFGSAGLDLDPTFFLTKIADFSILFSNISIGLPYISVDPSDCFNGTKNASAAGTDGQVTQCADNHNYLGPYAAQAADGGVLPVTGALNGVNQSGPDFVAQTDYNSPVTGVPEPGMLALLGVAFGAMGLASRRRRQS